MPREFCWVCIVGTLVRSEVMALLACDSCGFRTQPDEDETIRSAAAWRR